MLKLERLLNRKHGFGYDGFNEKGYAYRSRSCFIKYYFDSLPDNFDGDTMLLLFCIAELMNIENVLVYRVKRKSKFSSIVYKPYGKEDIRDKIRFRFGKNKFERCWRELRKHTIKQINYNNVNVWAVNPSVISKCRYVPFWLYEEFQESMNPHLSSIAIKKLQNKIAEYYDDSYVNSNDIIL